MLYTVYTVYPFRVPKKRVFPGLGLTSAFKTKQWAFSMKRKLEKYITSFITFSFLWLQYSADMDDQGKRKYLCSKGLNLYIRSQETATPAGHHSWRKKTFSHSPAAIVLFSFKWTPNGSIQNKYQIPDSAGFFGHSSSSQGNKINPSNYIRIILEYI